MNNVPRHPEEQRITELLRDLIGRAGLSLEAIERRLGWEAGKLPDLLESRRGVAMEDLLEILPLLGLEAEEFFARLYGFKERARPVEAVEKTAGTRLDRRFAESSRVIEQALARRAAWKRERGRE
jgi:transcriptional regulator with XRE-family HTH domain